MFHWRPDPLLKGTRRVITTQGGAISGPKLTGRVRPGGADFQLLTSHTLTEREATYVIETTSGERIYVANLGIGSGTPEEIAALVRGGQVPPERIHLRCTRRLLSSGAKGAG